MTRHRGGHDTDGAGPCHKDILTNQIKTQRGMHSVSKWIEDRADRVRDIIRQGHNIERRQFEILRKGALLVYADAPRAGVKMKLACAALARGFADQVPLTRTTLPNVQVLHVASDLDDLTCEFVTCDHGHRHGPRRPFIPVPDVNVRATDTCFVDFDQHIISTNFRNRGIDHPKPLTGVQF